MFVKPNFPLAVEGGPKNVEFTQLVNFLTNEIRTLLEIDEEVNPITAPEDSAAFIMEVTSFLRELSRKIRFLYVFKSLNSNSFFRLSI